MCNRRTKHRYSILLLGIESLKQSQVLQLIANQLSVQPDDLEDEQARSMHRWNIMTRAPHRQSYQRQMEHSKPQISEY